MRLIIIAALILLLPGQSSAESWTQSFWCEGPDFMSGIPSFYTFMSSASPENARFYNSRSIDWFSLYGDIELGYSENIICEVVQYPLEPFLQHTVICIDIDCDTDYDVLNMRYVPSNSGNFFYYLNLLDSFSSGLACTGPMTDVSGWFLPHADINNDGLDDLITNTLEYAGGPGLTVWIENGTWEQHIVTEHQASHDPAAIWSTDMDNDGDFDIISPYVQTGGLYALRWYENLDSGELWQVHAIAGYTDIPWCIQSADYDDDGDEDILISFLEAEKILLYENTGSEDTWIEHLVCESLYPSSAIFADIDGTGSLEILACDALKDNVFWLREESAGIWIKYIIDDSFDAAWSLKAEDFDCDGDIDVAGISRFNKFVMWWENADGSGQQWFSHKIGFLFEGTGIDIADINLDGYTDIVGSSYIFHQIKWFDISQKATSGELESCFLDTESELSSATIDWNAEIPSGTTLYFQVRSVTDLADLYFEEWSDEIYEPGTVEPFERYVQYKVSFESNNPGITPVLHDITLNWTELGIEPGEHSPGGFELFPVSPNPARGGAEIRFAVPEELHVSLNVFDISGRLVSIPIDAVLPEGEHSVSVEGLSTGIYFYRMISSGFSDIKRMIVLE